MPVVPTYDSKASLNPGAMPGVRLSNAESAADLGQAQSIQGAGKALEGVGSAIMREDEWKRRRGEQDENLRTTLSLDTFSKQQAAELDKARREGMPVDGSGFAESRVKAFDAAAASFLKTVPERLRDEYGQRINSQRVGQGAQADVAELEQKRWWTRKSVNELSSSAADEVREDREGADPAMARLAKTVNDSRLSAAEKLEALANIRDSIKGAEALKRYGKDAEAMAGALGRLPKGSIPQAASSAMSILMGRGWTREQAAGIVGNLDAESKFNTGARNPGDGRDGSDSIGMGQWNGGRDRTLKEFAAARGKPWTDFETQVLFIDHELRTSPTERTAFDRLRAAKTVEEATAAAIGYERPRGYTHANPTAGHNWAGRLASARRIVGSGGNDTGDQRYADLSPQAKDKLMTYATQGQAAAERAQRSDAVQVAGLVRDDILSIRGTGSGIPELSTARVQAALGPEKATQWEQERGQALEVHRGSAGFETMTGEQIQGRVEQFRPGDGDSGVGYAGKAAVYAQLQERADQIVKSRFDDPAMAVNDAPEVRAATRSVAQANGSDAGANEALVAARYRAQSSIGIPDTSRSPIPMDMAKQYATRLRPLAKGQAEAVNQDRIVESVVGDIQAKYGKYARDVLTQVLYQVTLKKDASEVLATAIERMQTTDSGPVIRSDETRRVEIEDQGHQIGEATGASIDPMGGVSAPGGAAPSAPATPPAEKGFDAALKLLDSDPAKYLKGFRERFGDARVPAKLRDRMKPNG